MAMMQAFQQDFEAQLTQALAEAVRNVADPIIGRTLSEIEKAARERVAAIAVSLTRMAHFERFGNELRITIKFDGALK